MRISVDPHDIGYWARAARIKVFLDEAELLDCVTADEGAGVAVCFVRDADGKFVADPWTNDVMTEERRGVVRIELPSPEDSAEIARRDGLRQEALRRSRYSAPAPVNAVIEAARDWLFQLYDEKRPGGGGAQGRLWDALVAIDKGPFREPRAPGNPGGDASLPAGRL